MSKTWNEHQAMMYERLGQVRMMMIDINTTILSARLDCGWSVRDLAKASGVKRKRIKQMERHDADITLVELSHICTALDVDLEVTLEQKAE